MRALLALLVALPALALVGCGGDDESVQTQPTRPELTVPGEDGGARGGDDTTDTGTDETTGGQTAPPAQAPAQQPQSTPQQQDTPQNDTPPPQGSPAERFEDFCAQNPGAC